jgi:glycosyltransferase involved in cell wall biosynthesis
MSLNVLLVNYTFPPVGGVNVLRVASLARYLPAHGIRVDVLTTRNPSSVGTDPSLLNDVPAEVTVHRTITLDLPFGVKKTIKRLLTGSRPPTEQAPKDAAPSNPNSAKPNPLKRIVQDALLPDPQVTWVPILTRAAHRIVRDRKIDLVLISCAPFSTLRLAETLRKQFPRLPIVLDFRDEWLSTTFDVASFNFSRTERARTFSVEAEARAVRSATSVVSVTEASRREIRSRYPQEPEQKFEYIPNGFDATRIVPSTWAQGPRKDSRIVVAYVGSVYASTEPTMLVEALKSLPEELRSRFLIRFIGHIEEPRYRAALLELGAMVELQGYLPQREALAAMNEADYVLLVTHDRLNVSAKFYDYIGAGKPILACLHPEGDARRLLEQLHAGWWADSGDVAAMRRLFVEAANRGTPPFADFNPDFTGIAAFERSVIAGRYAELLHSIADNSTSDGAMQPAAPIEAAKA